MAAIGAFGIDAARLHWDFTSVAFCGAYDNQDTAAPRIGYGHSSDRKAHRRQLKVAHATTASGDPVVRSGGRRRPPRGSRNRRAPRAVCVRSPEPRRLLLVADSALVTKANLAAADASGIRFVSRLPRSFDYETDALAQPNDAWRTFTYRAERSRRLPPAERPTFRGAEATIDMVGPDKVARRFRVLYIYGSEEAAAARASRARLLVPRRSRPRRHRTGTGQPNPAKTPNRRTPRRQGGGQGPRRPVVANRSAQRRRWQPCPCAGGVTTTRWSRQTARRPLRARHQHGPTAMLR